MNAQEPSATVTLCVPEIRDYQRLNQMLRQALDGGAQRVRLDGVEGQRLLLQGLTGPWHATVEIVGSAGPELAFGMNAPALSVVCDQSAADGAGAWMRGGRLIVRGDCGDAVGIGMRGGAIVCLGTVGARAGLRQTGGLLLLASTVGALAGERQAGGALVMVGHTFGADASHTRIGGRVVRAIDALDPSERRAVREAVSGFEAELPETLRPILHEMA